MIRRELGWFQHAGIITYMLARFPDKLREDCGFGALKSEGVDVGRRHPGIAGVSFESRA